MAKRRRIFYCSIHGGPILGRGWGGHKSHGTCPNGKRLTEKEFIAKGGNVDLVRVTAPRKGADPAIKLEAGIVDGIQKEAVNLRAKITNEIVELEARLDHLRDALAAMNKILKVRV